MLLERTEELAGISAALDQTRLGRGTCLVVEGPSGIGKSALLSAARMAAENDGFTVVRARAGKWETDYPYAVIRQLFERYAVQDDARPLNGAAAQAASLLRSEPGTEPGPDSGFAMAHALYWFIANLADEAPLMIAVDDAHHCDFPSLEVLRYLIRRLEGLRVLVLIATRTTRSEEPVADLQSEPHVESLRPRLLSVEACARIVTSQAHDTPSPAFIAACHHASGGNPFLLAELLRALRRGGLSFDDDAVAAIGRLTPRAVSRSVLPRLADLPPAATDLARAVATLGDSAELRHAAELASVAASESAALADALAEVGVLAVGRPLRFVHPMIGDAVAEEIQPGQRAALHRRAAHLLSADGHGPERLAQHLVLTEPLRDPWVVSTLHSAARLARDQGAMLTARRWLSRAQAEGVLPHDARLLRDLAEAEWLTGSPELARAHLLTALTGPGEPDEITSTALLLAQVAASQTLVSEAAEVISSAISDNPQVSARMRRRLAADSATYALLNGVAGSTVRQQLAALDDETARDDESLLVSCSLAATCLFDGSAAQAIGYARRGLREGRLFEAGLGDSFPVLGALTGYFVSDEEDECAAILETALQHARRRSSAVAFANACGASAIAAWMRGDVRRCEAMAREAIEPGFGTGYVWPILYAYLALARLEQGDLDGARHAIQTGDLDNAKLKSSQSSHAAYAVARVLRAEGDPAAALTVVQAHAAIELPVNLLPYPPWRLEMARCLYELGELPQAERCLAENAAYASRWGTATIIGASQRVHALISSGADRVVRFREAVATLAASPARLEYAYATVELGTALRKAGDTGAAATALRSGYDLAGSLGAVTLADQARHELLGLGLRPRRLRLNGVDALTARERRVCELAALGHSNSDIAQALFVTRSTVEKHLGHAYTKLAITSRHELAAVFPEVG